MSQEISEPVIEPAQPGHPQVPSRVPPRMTDREVAWEVLAILCVGVLPHVWFGIMDLMDLRPRMLDAYWRHCLDYLVLDAFTILAVLYVMYRSDESWQRFGIVWPRWMDLGLGLAVLLADKLVLSTLSSYLPLDSVGREQLFPRPGQRIDYWLMVPSFAVSAFAEELITRAYLITRLERLLGAKVHAVVISAILCGSYHLYQGFWHGVVSTTLFGLLFGGLYLLVRRIWPFVLAHMLGNIMADLLA